VQPSRPQGAEFIEYFCGMECYQEFMAAQKSIAEKPQK